jgi:hypothetical protein
LLLVDPVSVLDLLNAGFAMAYPIESEFCDCAEILECEAVGVFEQPLVDDLHGVSGDGGKSTCDVDAVLLPGLLVEPLVVGH